MILFIRGTIYRHPQGFMADVNIAHYVIAINKRKKLVTTSSNGLTVKLNQQLLNPPKICSKKLQNIIEIYENSGAVNNTSYTGSHRKFNRHCRCCF